MTHTNFTIIGGGILGLCVAEYFSRTHRNVTLFNNEHPLAGSKAAAANLSTKGQLFGRDAHFQMKLEAKKIYAQWINNLREEISFHQDLKNIFRCGPGIDIFCNAQDTEAHFKRVSQNTAELVAKNLPTDHIACVKCDINSDKNHIIYKDEAWVDAPLLLQLLGKVLKKRSVILEKKIFSLPELKNIENQKNKNILIFCTGAWTKETLLNLNLPFPKGFLKSERLTLGSTFQTLPCIDTLFKDFVLIEKISEGLKHKGTVSGLQEAPCISSTSVKITQNIKIDDIGTFYQEQLTVKADELKKLLKVPSFTISQTGIRVGYGHSELIIEPLALDNKNFHALVCCGAHKSGFLFGPMVGQKIENMISQCLL